MKKFTKKEIFSIPNIMGYFRILLIPVFCYLYITAESEREYLYAAFVVLISSLTDLFDGKIARRFNMITELGKALDPIADKLTHGALAVCLAAGIDGIRNKIEPPEEVPENVYELKEEEKASRGIESLPADLHAAICELQKDAFIKEVLGEHISSKLIEAKEAEWMQYRTQVTGWEIEEYLYKI